MTDPAFPAQLIQATLDTYAGLDIIVNNAGYTWDGVIQNMTDKQWQAMLDVHVTAPFRILREASQFIEPASAETPVIHAGEEAGVPFLGRGTWDNICSLPLPF